MAAGNPIPRVSSVTAAATTLGPTGPVGAPDTGNDNNISASPVTTDSDGGIITALSAYEGQPNAGDQFGLAVYSDVGGQPGLLLAATGPAPLTGAGWQTLPVTPLVLQPSTTYWLAYNSSGSDDSLYYVGNGEGLTTWSGAVPFSSGWPATYPGVAGSDTPGYLLYATLVGSSLPPITQLMPPTETASPAPPSATAALPEIALSPTPSAVPPTATSTTGKHLIFDDEFNGTSLDTGVWTALNRPGDASNNETQYYSPSQVSESGGNLAITVAPDMSHAGYSYASGMVQWSSFNFTYGTVEIRAKLPAGAWPALWLLGSACQTSNITNPDNVGTCDWPALGSEEIDMTEVWGSRTSINQQIHSSLLGSPGCTATVSDAAQNWHTYDLVWEPGSLVWHVDGVTTCTLSEAPSRPSFLLMNVAESPVMPPVSGPQQLLIDYVQVYQQAAGSAAPTATNTQFPADAPATTTPIPAPATSTPIWQRWFWQAS
jgi:beta-glucanase (GH16 family)